MGGVGRRVRVALLAAAAAAGGCATKPYDRDPLLSHRYGVRGDRTVAARPLPLPVEPAGPDAPPGPLRGDTGFADVTSR
jgi:hypothetical protein